MARQARRCRLEGLWPVNGRGGHGGGGAGRGPLDPGGGCRGGQRAGDHRPVCRHGRSAARAPDRRGARGRRESGGRPGVAGSLQVVWLGIVGLALPSPTPGAVPGANIFSSPLLLSVIVWVPVIMAVAIATMPNPRGRFDTLMKQIAFFTNVGLVFVLWIAYNQFESFLSTPQFAENQPWLAAIGASYHLGVDVPGMTMLPLSGLICIVALLASLGIPERVLFYFLRLVLTT